MYVCFDRFRTFRGRLVRAATGSQWGHVFLLEIDEDRDEAVVLDNGGMASYDPEVDTFDVCVHIDTPLDIYDLDACLTRGEGYDDLGTLRLMLLAAAVRIIGAGPVIVHGDSKPVSHCASLVGEALQHVGVLPTSFDVNYLSPGTIAYILEAMGYEFITPDEAIG
jgi:hypothetical protein